MQADDGDNGSGNARNPADKIDTAAITEAIRQQIIDLDAEVERINAAREAMPQPQSALRTATHAGSCLR